MSNNILSLVPRMLAGDELKAKLEAKPYYDERIREKGQAERLVAMNDIYGVYLPSDMSMEIYSKIYLAMLRSLQKKESKLAMEQRNENFKVLKGQLSVSSYQGIVGGSDSFTIIGSSGIGKSSAISRAIELATENKIIVLEEPFLCKIIPCIVVQCPFDCSVKSLFLQILKQVDEEIKTHYYEMAIKSKATTDMLIGIVSQVALNHIGLLVVDEIQNVVRHKGGVQLVGMLTQLINNSGISIGMVGTPEVEIFFERVDYLARRSLGLKYDRCEYNEYFCEVCKELYSLQYVQKRTEITDAATRWLYEHSGGVIALVVALIHDAQEIAILEGIESLDLSTLHRAYDERLGLMHEHIRPMVRTLPNSNQGIKAMELPVQERKQETMETFTIEQLVTMAKKTNMNIVDLLRDKIGLTEIEVEASVV